MTQSERPVSTGRSFSLVMANFHRSAFTDTQCGLKAWHSGFSTTVVQRLEDPGWSFDLEMINRAEAQEASILELPIAWTDRDGSKVRALVDGPRMLRRGVRYYLRFTPRVLMVVGLITFVLCLTQALDGKNEVLVRYGSWVPPLIARMAFVLLEFALLAASLILLKPWTR